MNVRPGPRRCSVSIRDTSPNASVTSYQPQHLLDGCDRRPPTHLLRTPSRTPSSLQHVRTVFLPFNGLFTPLLQSVPISAPTPHSALSNSAHPHLSPQPLVILLQLLSTLHKHCEPATVRHSPITRPQKKRWCIAAFSVPHPKRPA